MKKCLLVFIPLFLTASLLLAETIEVKPVGTYAEINTQNETQAINSLLNGTPNEQSQTAEEIVKHSDKYCPATFFYLSAYFFDKGQNDDALFWLYAGRIRMLYDVKKCTDESVDGALEEMNSQVPDLLKLTQFENINNTRKIVAKAIAWDEKTPHDYDPAWLSLHGAKAFLPDADKVSYDSLNIQKDQWNSLAKENRKEYLKDFNDSIEQITKEDLAQIKQAIKELKKQKN